jgi:hypothetical protein
MATYAIQYTHNTEKPPSRAGTARLRLRLTGSISFSSIQRISVPRRGRHIRNEVVHRPPVAEAPLVPQPR